MVEKWIYVAIVAVFALGYWIGHRKGKFDAQQEMMFHQQQLEATRMWTESLSKYMGGENGLS